MAQGAEKSSTVMLIGAPNCSRCAMAKKNLTNRGIQFTYTQLDELNVEDRQKYLELAKKAGHMQLPVIIKNNASITLKEVIS